MNLSLRIKSFIRERVEPRWFGNDMSRTDDTPRATASGEVVTDQSALALSGVWACVNLLAGTTASLPFMVYEDRGGERVPARSHPLWRVLHESPNYDQTAVDFWEYLSASLELWGNAYAAINRAPDGRIIALRPAPPSEVSVTRLPSGVLEYAWTDEGQRYRLTDADVLHIRGFGGGPMGGLSTLSFARQSFGIAQAQDRMAGNTFRNGMAPAGAIVFPEFLSPENRKTAESVLIERHAGAVNAGRPLILEGGTKWQPLTINPEDAQMLESRQFSIEEVCRFFGVPPHMIGHTSKSTSWGTGIEQQVIGFQKFTLRRRLRRIEQAVSKQLLSADERARGMSVQFNLEGLLRADSAGRASFYNTMTMIGAMTINEVRALENLPPVQGGDVPRMQAQNIPITEATTLTPQEGEGDDE